MAILFLLPVVAVSYLVGATPFGYLVACWKGVDIFRHGSGNIGATNVGRVLGRPLGILVFCLDFAKGAVPVLVASLLCMDMQQAIPPRSPEVLAGLAAFLGHLFPIYLRFRGGKGVATGAGVVAVLLPLPALAALVTWVGVLAAFRYVSLASLAAVVALCLAQLWTPEPFAPDHVIMTVFCFLTAALVFLRHRSNLARLAHGTENRLQDSPTMLLLSKTIHVLSLGLWLGSVFFFTFIMAPTIFGQLESLAENDKRPGWFPLDKNAYGKSDDRLPGPREQGTRMAGYAISPLFPIFFALQGALGFLATTTALGWPRLQPTRKVHKIRVVVLTAALLTVVIGWPLEQYVDQLRKPRHETVERFLLAEKGSPSEQAAKEEALTAKSEFFLWHMLSLGLDLVTFILVAVALALAAQLPDTGLGDRGRESGVRSQGSGIRGQESESGTP
jgi:glycerol-3-phosphate acyltransferase PlsY